MKGQVTIFIILGLMVLIIFGFFFFLILKTESTVSTSELDTSPLVPYLQSCLDSSLVSSLEILGEGGGFLFKGYFKNPLKDEGIGLDSGNYLIYNNKPVPIYFNKTTIHERIFPLICKENQPKDCVIGVTSPSDIPCDCTCTPSSSVDCDNSLQNYLELSVRKKFLSCYKKIPDFFPGLITKIQIGEVTSLFSPSTIAVSLYSNLTIGSSDETESIVMPPISSTSIRLSLVSVQKQLFRKFQDDLSSYDFNLLYEINETIPGVVANRFSTRYGGKDYWVTNLTFSDFSGFLAGRPFHWYYATEKRELFKKSDDLTPPSFTCYDLDDMTSSISCV